VTSEPLRDPVSDPLLTPQNSALLVIDYQPSQIQTVTSIDHELLTRNIVSVARLAKTYGLPIVALDCECRRQRATADHPGTEGGPFGVGRDRPHSDQLLGGRRLPEGGRGDGPEEAGDDSTVDRGVPGFPGSGRTP
jgi:hypothetical protein